MLLLYYSLRNRSYKSGSKFFISIISIVLIVLSGLRHEGVGNDTYAYMLNYVNNSNLSWEYVFDDFVRRFLSPMGNGEKDPAYLILIKIMHILHINVRLYLFVIATILLIPLGVFVYRNSKNLKTVLFSYCLYVTLFYGYLPNSAIRQSIALSFVLWAYLYIIDKEHIFISICLIVIGSMFHKSALITLIIIPFLYIDNIQFFYKLALIPFSAILIFPTTIAQFIVGDYDIYSGYSSGDYYTNRSRPYIIILLISFFYYLGWIYIKNFDRKKIACHQKTLLIGCAFTFMLVPLIWVNPSALRIISYFCPCMAIIVGYALSDIKNKNIIYVLVIISFLYKSISSFGEYHFMWENMKLHERYAENIVEKYEVKKTENIYYV